MSSAESSLGLRIPYLVVCGVVTSICCGGQLVFLGFHGRGLLVAMYGGCWFPRSGYGLLRSGRWLPCTGLGLPWSGRWFATVETIGHPGPPSRSRRSATPARLAGRDDRPPRPT
jgi:hypothetical protein